MLAKDFEARCLTNCVTALSYEPRDIDLDERLTSIVSNFSIL
jgi:hypothetical protein